LKLKEEKYEKKLQEEEKQRAEIIKQKQLEEKNFQDIKIKSKKKKLIIQYFL
jgi:hypothetical protein